MIIYKSLKPLFLMSLFALVSCFDRQPLPTDTGGVPGGRLTPELIDNRCIRHKFSQGNDDHLYGRDCIEGKEIKIKSASQGEPISLMSTSGGEESIVIEEGVDFINQVYDLDYKILKSKGDDKEVPFLMDFIAEGEDFQGIPGKEYSLIFKTVGNYLILYKATEDKNNIPYNERTSMEKTESGDSLLYMVPFIGYPIEYCKPEYIRNNQQEITNLVRAKCNSEPSRESPYLNVNTGKKQRFKYLKKQDIFPADYFDGEWFFAKTHIDSNTSSEITSADSKLSEIKKESDALVVIDNSGNNSGNMKDINKKRIFSLPIDEWLEFELAKENDSFSSFGERKNTDGSSAERPYIKISLQDFGDSTEKIVISPDYFSFVYLDSIGEKTTRYKVSLLRKSYLKFDRFQPKKWFKEDDKKNFNLFESQPQATIKSISSNETDLHSHLRVVKFDTSLYTKAEEENKTKVIKWYFSKNSTKETHYRELAQEAMAIYNRAFEIIAGDGEAPKIQFHLVEGEEKDLGDMRYNIMNLIKIVDISKDNSNLLGFAPSHKNPDTGQTISSVSNIAIHSVEEIFRRIVRDYTRYEIFQSHKLSDEENKNHVVSDYIRWKIQKECNDLSAFINENRKNISDYRKELGDLNLRKACAVKVSRPYLLFLILHEMGHSSSMGHNFECSRDEKNFYKDLDEMKKYFPKADLADLEKLQEPKIQPIPKSSCVMDYPSHEALPLTVLGKNDIMVLRYVYEDELELAGHELENPVLHQMDFNYENLNEQKSLFSNTKLMGDKKIYLNCNDEAVKTQIGCDLHDYGASYEEITENLVLEFKRKLKLRYTYDLADSLIQINSPQLKDFLDTTFPQMYNYHQEWIKLRNIRLKSKSQLDLLNYFVNDEERIEDYNAEVSDFSKTTQEYKDFYPVADLFRSTMKEVLFQRPLHCRVQSEDGTRTKDIDFGYLIVHLIGLREKGLYVIDCYSDQVVKFLNENSLKLIGQYGMLNVGIENKNKYGTYGFSKDTYKKPDYVPLESLFDVFINKKRWLVDSLQDVNILKDIDEELKKNILDINQYGNDSEIERNNQLLKIVSDTIITDSTSSEAISLYKQDIQAFMTYKSQANSGSFYKNIEEPLNNNHNSIDNFESSFLKKLYEDYKASDTGSSFQSYITGEEGVALIKDKTQWLYIPVRKKSFAYKMAIKYNEVLNEIKELENRDSKLSLLDKFHKEKLYKFRDNFNKFAYYYNP